jgi:hypothetical protein
MALPFDLATLRVTGGQAVELAERVWEGGAEGRNMRCLMRAPWPT